jgi:hypothetical protein
MGGPESSLIQDEGNSEIPDGEMEIEREGQSDIDKAVAGSLTGKDNNEANINFEGMDD